MSAPPPTTTGRRRRRAPVAVAAALLLAVVVLVGGPPAGAAPGDASAFGLSADLDISVLGVDADIAGTLGAVSVNEASVPPTQTAALVGADAILSTVPVAAYLQASAISTGASTDPATGSSAYAEVADAQLAIAALPVVGELLIDGDGTVLRAEADCPAGGTPTATADETLTLLVAGISVDLTADVDAVVDLSAAGIDGTVTLDLNQTVVTSDTAAATVLQLSVTLSALAGTVTVAGDVTLASASCESVAVAPAPTTTGISPDNGPTTGGTEVTITGADFVPGATSVTIGGNTVAAGDVSVAGDGASLTFTTPAHAAGPVDVTVTTPGGESSPPLGFTYNPSGPAPTTASLSPDEGPTSGGTSVTVTGSDFVVGGTSVTIGGTTVPASEVTVAPGGASLTFTTPAHAAGAVDVTVTTPDGTSTPPLAFTYVPDAVTPTATSLSPDQGPTTGGTEVTIEGSGFVAGETSVIIGVDVIPSSEVTVADDGMSLVFTTPPHTPGGVAVTVSTPGGTTTPPLEFTYVAGPDVAPPTVDELTPPQGPTAGGTTVVIVGSGFVEGETTVTIGGTTIPAGDVTVSPDGTMLSFVTPPHAAGEVPVSVTTPGGTVAAPPFTYVEATPSGPTGNGGTPTPTPARNAGGSGNGSGTRTDGSGNGSGSGGGGNLARTGTDISGLLLVSAASLALGTLLLSGRRRGERSVRRIG